MKQFKKKSVETKDIFKTRIFYFFVYIFEWIFRILKKILNSNF